MNQIDMSTTNLGKSTNKVDKYYRSLFSVDNSQPETLAEFVQRIRKEKGYSTQEVERRSGFTITDGYVSRIENNGVKNVSLEKLRALAKGLGVSEEEISDVASGKRSNDSGVFNDVKILFYGAENWTKRQRKIMKELIRKDVDFVNSLTEEDSEDM